MIVMVPVIQCPSPAIATAASFNGSTKLAGMASSTNDWYGPSLSIEFLSHDLFLGLPAIPSASEARLYALPAIADLLDGLLYRAGRTAHLLGLVTNLVILPAGYPRAVLFAATHRLLLCFLCHDLSSLLRGTNNVSPSRFPAWTNITAGNASGG